MCKKVILIAAVTLFAAANSQVYGRNIWEQQTLTNGFRGLNDSLAPGGMEVGAGVTKIYQLNVNGIFSNNASTTCTDDNDGVFEVCYNARVTPWMNVSPMIRYVADPGGNDTTEDADVFGVRTQWTF
ncbi:MAG: carbohydrate porin [Sedimentisphaerales bacterium]|nr:carbohydrate porin [Sedimentisphaerales bacterium]